MKTTDNGRAEARSRANRRLRKMTIGTAMLGVVATGTLGWMAAGTQVGVATTIGTTAPGATALGATAQSTTAQSTTATPNAASGGSSANVPAVTSVGGGAHVSTGAS